MEDFSFLSNVKLVEVKKESKTRTAAGKQPESGNVLRVYKNGKVFPSNELVANYLLEFQPKDSDIVSYGFDVFTTASWPMWPQGAPNLIVVAAVPKDSPKVSLFGQCTYNEDGSPKSSVTTQGGGSFGKELAEMVVEVLNVDFEKVDYVDLKIADTTIPGPETGIYFIPKVVSRGEKKGQVSVVRRENIAISPIYLLTTSVANDTPIEEEEPTDNAPVVTTPAATEVPEQPAPIATPVPETPVAQPNVLQDADAAQELAEEGQNLGSNNSGIKEVEGSAVTPGMPQMPQMPQQG